MTVICMIHFMLAYQNQLKPILLLSEYWFEKLMVRLGMGLVYHLGGLQH